MNGLSYYDYTFFKELPRVYASLEDQLAAHGSGLEDRGAAVLPAHGQLDRRRPRRQSLRDGGRAAPGPAAAEQARARLLSGGAPSASAASCRSTAAMSNVSEQVQALANASPDLSPHRQDEPYRRAISGIYARLAATAAASRPWRRRAPCGGRGAGLCRASRNSQAIFRSCTARSLSNGSALPGARTAAQAAPRGRRVRLSSGQPRHAPEFRRA